MQGNLSLDEAVESLRQSQEAGLKFAEARQKLLNAGFTPEEVDAAADRFDYSPSTFTSDIPSGVVDYYEKHPEQATDVAAGNCRHRRKKLQKNLHKWQLLMRSVRARQVSLVLSV